MLTPEFLFSQNKDRKEWEQVIDLTSSQVLEKHSTISSLNR